MISKISDWQRALSAIENSQPCQFDPEPLLRAFPYKTEHWEDFIKKTKDYFAQLSHS